MTHKRAAGCLHGAIACPRQESWAYAELGQAERREAERMHTPRRSGVTLPLAHRAHPHPCNRLSRSPEAR